MSLRKVNCSGALPIYTGVFAGSRVAVTSTQPAAVTSVAAVAAGSRGGPPQTPSTTAALNTRIVPPSNDETEQQGKHQTGPADDRLRDGPRLQRLRHGHVEELLDPPEPRAGHARRPRAAWGRRPPGGGRGGWRRGPPPRRPRRAGVVRRASLAPRRRWRSP